MLPTSRYPRYPEIREAASEVLVAAERQASLDVVVSLLDDSHARVRKNALAILATCGKDAPLSSVVQVSRNTEELDWVRQVAVQTLGAIGTDAAIQIVLDYVVRRDELIPVRWTAIEVLGKSVAGPSADRLAAVAEALSDETQQRDVGRCYSIRGAAARALVGWASHIALDDDLARLLVRLALGDDPTIGNDYGNGDLLDSCEGATEAVIALQGTTSHVEALVNVLRDTTAPAHDRVMAVHLLGLVRAHVPAEPLLQALHEDPRLDVRWAAAHALGERCAAGDLSREVLEQHLLPLLEDPDQGWSAFKGLAALGFEAPPIVKENVVAALRGNHSRARGDAIGRLNRWPADQLPREDLVAALADDEGTWCTEIMGELSRLGEHVPVETFVAVLEDGVPNSNVNYDTPPWARVLAAKALGNLGEHAPIEPLIRAVQLEDTFENSYIRAAALEALGNLGDRAPLDVIVAAFSDDNDLVRTAAAKACAHPGKRAPVDSLLAAVGDASSDVRRAALDALKLVAPDALLSVLREAEAILQSDEQAAHYLAPLIGKLTI
jgi:HEAT repeat protein